MAAFRTTLWALIVGSLAVLLTVGVLLITQAPRGGHLPPAAAGVHARAASVTAADLLVAPVPANCRHPAGKLSDGILPGIPKNEGRMRLAWIGDETRKPDLLALGDLTGDGVGDAAAVLYCDAGGVSWPEMIGFYAPGPRLLGTVFLDRVNLPGHEPGENATVNKITYKRGVVHAGWTTQQKGDAGCCPTLDYTADLTWNGSTITTSNLSTVSESDTAARFLSEVRQGRSSQAAALAGADVVDWAVDLARTEPGPFAAVPACRGRLDDLPPSISSLVTPGMGNHADDTDRVCYVQGTSGYLTLGMKRLGFGRWQVGWIGIV